MKTVIRLASIVLLLAAGLMPSLAQANDLPDLLPDQVLTTTVYQGLTNTVTVLTGNKGVTDPSAFSAPDFNVTLHANGVLVGTQSVSSSQPWGWPAYTFFTWTPPAPGSYTLVATADSSDQIVESDESNNVLPVQVEVLPLAPVTLNVRVEGQTGNIWNGPVTFLSSTITDNMGDTYTLDRPTALGALDAAAQAGGFEYVVTSDYGPLSYLLSIEGQGPSGSDGWNYRVDWFMPSVSAADYSVGPANLEVLWYYGAWDAKPLKLSTDRTSLADTDFLSVTVEAYDDFTSSWSPVDGATIHAGGLTFLTDVSGQASFQLPAGSHVIYAEKGDYTQYTRSNVVQVQVIPAQDLPDLAPDQVLTTTVYQGLTNTVTVLTGNKGVTDPAAFSAPDFNVTLHANGVLVGTQSVSSSQPWGWPAYTFFTWTPPAPGSYTLVATADSSGQIVESDESNNVLSVQVEVLPLSPVTLNVRVEGQTGNIWNGPVTFLSSTITDNMGDTYTLDRPTALGALDAAAQAGGFEYVVTSDYGPLSYLLSIEGQGPSGFDGWNYRVDWLSPNVGARDYSLGPDNVEVLWYYGSWGAKPLKLSTDRPSLADTDFLSVTVEAYDDFAASWSPVDGATIHAGGLTFLTDVSGQASFQLPAGSHDVYAEKGDYTQYTRSNVVQVQVVLPGDVDGDGHVGLTDLVAVAAAFGSHSGDARYNQNADLNQDGAVNIFDLVVVGLRYGA